MEFKPDEKLSQIWGDYFYFYKIIEEEGEEVETIIKVKEKDLFNRKS